MRFRTSPPLVQDAPLVLLITVVVVPPAGLALGVGARVNEPSFWRTKLRGLGGLHPLGRPELHDPVVLGLGLFLLGRAAAEASAAGASAAVSAAATIRASERSGTCWAFRAQRVGEA